MADIIKLLPDAVANQIAAGEVIQRPASAVKELLENAVDAGASDIKLIIKDAGKTLIQVIDNGCGMSETDARMSFERHATSKIQSADDLFSIRTMGFRGEALASIAAIAHVELKSKKLEDELGTLLEIEGSKVKKQEPVSCPDGTSISIKNLFFNVPARRNFLKSDAAELRHIIEEFQRVALVYPGISMSLFNNKRFLYQLKVSNQKQRIINILGSNYTERIIPMEQKTDKVNIHGFIGKPEFAKKTRGEQYFFANKRFIKHPYMHHAVDSAFQELLPSGAFPTYFIFIDIDPGFIDVNIHPTKTEVNFQDNQLIYAILRSSIKQSLGKFNIIPSIDFEIEQSFDLDNRPADQPVKNPFIREKTGYNPFDTAGSALSQQRNTLPSSTQNRNTENWQDLYEIARGKTDTGMPEPQKEEASAALPSLESAVTARFFQVQNRYIITVIKSGLMIIDQHNAHMRVLYEKFLASIQDQKAASQQELFPRNLVVSPDDAEILREIKEELEITGFSIKELGSNTFVVDGTPSGYENNNINDLIEGVLENYKKDIKDVNIDKKVKIARAMAANMAVKKGKKMHAEEMEVLIDELFRCSVPDKTPDGRLTFYTVPFDDIDKRFL